MPMVSWMVGPSRQRNSASIWLTTPLKSKGSGMLLDLSGFMRGVGKIR
jgi:hypothetical protein